MFHVKLSQDRPKLLCHLFGLFYLRLIYLSALEHFVDDVLRISVVKLLFQLLDLRKHSLHTAKRIVHR